MLIYAKAMAQASVLGGAATAFLLLLFHCDGVPIMSPAQEVVIGGTASDVAVCDAEGRASNSYRVYDACMCRHGFRDAGCAPHKLDPLDPWGDSGPVHIWQSDGAPWDGGFDAGD